MRQVLIGYIRKAEAIRPGGGVRHYSLEERDFHSSPWSREIEVNDLLERLMEIAPESAEALVRKCYFLCTTKEIAEQMKLPTWRVVKHLKYARAWILSNMKGWRDEHGT
jgi:DNA-directed RNA polymerase specialized sigma24 family protein